MVITIGREFGSGGKYIGEQVAKKLEMKFYDKEILQRLSKEENIDIHLLENVDENNRNSFWYTLAMSSMSFSDSVNSLTDLPMNDKYFIETSKLIEKIAKEDNCVIIGRCANMVLRGHKDVVNLFIYSSDEEFKVKRKVEFANLDEKKAIKMMEKKDKERASYYHYYTNEKWGARSGYDLLIDSSKLGVDGTVDMIVEYVRRVEEKAK